MKEMDPINPIHAFTRRTTISVNVMHLCPACRVAVWPVVPVQLAPTSHRVQMFRARFSVLSLFSLSLFLPFANVADNNFGRFCLSVRLSVCVCLCLCVSVCPVRALTFESLDLESVFFVCIISRSGSHIKVIGSRSRSPECKTRYTSAITYTHSLFYRRRLKDKASGNCLISYFMITV